MQFRMQAALWATAVALAAFLLGQARLQAQTYPAPNPYVHTQYQQSSPYAQPGYTQPGYPQPGYQPGPQSGSQSGYGQQQQGYPAPGYPQQDPYANQQPSQQQYSDDYPDSGYGQNPQAYGQDYGQQNQPVAEPLSAEQLEQLVAPIALYPDSLVAQVLAAATYPAQVVAADHWRQSMGYPSADQIVAGANAQSWDPSVKALTAFPQVLSEMDHNLQWTTDLGNAYFNQPQDVLQTIQVMRQRAQSAGTLQSTPQEQVTYDQGYIQLAPPTPQVVYVPTYDPWSSYGEPVQPYSGFSLAGVFGTVGSFLGSGLLHYGPGIAMGAFSSTPWGWVTWALNWLGQCVLFNHSNYYSHSTSVAHWNLPEHGRGWGNRGGYGDRAFAGRPGSPYNRNPRGNGWLNQGPTGQRPQPIFRGPERGTERLPDRFAGNRPTEPRPVFGRPIARPIERPIGPPIQRGFEPVRPGIGRPVEGYGFRGGDSPRGASPIYRSPVTAPQRGFGERFNAPSYRSEPFKPERSGGFHPFGGGHHSDFGYSKPPKMPHNFGHEKAPRMPHFSEHGHSGGGHAGGGHSGGHFFGGHHH